MIYFAFTGYNREPHGIIDCYRGARETVEDAKRLAEAEIIAGEWGEIVTLSDGQLVGVSVYGEWRDWRNGKVEFWRGWKDNDGTQENQP